MWWTAALWLSLLLPLVHAQGFLDFLNFGLSGVRPRQTAPTIGDFTNQGLGLLNYFTSIQRNPVRSKPRQNEVNLLGLPGVKGVPDAVGLPNIPFLDGVPVVPGVAGSFPGVGECLPKGTPLINPISPSLFQNFLRNIPGAQDVLRSLVNVPGVKTEALMGKWHWVVITPSVHTRYCATSEYSRLTSRGTADATFSVFDSFRDGSPYGTPKIGFGYGLKNLDRISIYSQSDPCPYQVVAVGPQSRGGKGQYEWLILSNWAKYPVIGLVRNVRLYELQYRRQMDEVLRREGFLNLLTDALGTVQFVDWQQCKANTVTTGNIVGNLLNNILFG